MQYKKYIENKLLTSNRKAFNGGDANGTPRNLSICFPERTLSTDPLTLPYFVVFVTYSREVLLNTPNRKKTTR